MRPSDDTTDARGDSLSLRERILKETALIGALVLAGLVGLPALIYLVGRTVFGEYGGGSFLGFYVRLHEALRSGEPAVVFLLLSPCILWLLLRMTVWLFRHLGGRPA